MSILLKSVQRYNPYDAEAPMKWYPVQAKVGMADEMEVAELVAEETTLNPMEALMTLRQLRKVVERLLLEGRSVQLGNLGSLNLSLGTEGAGTREELSPRHVKSVRINFRASEGLRSGVQKAHFVWVDKVMRKEQE